MSLRNLLRAISERASAFISVTIYSLAYSLSYCTQVSITFSAYYVYEPMKALTFFSTLQTLKVATSAITILPVAKFQKLLQYPVALCTSN
jgi:hypothetical protein